MEPSLSDRADACLNRARGDRLNATIVAANDKTPRPAVYLGQQGDHCLVQRLGEGVTASGVLQTNGGIPTGGRIEVIGNSVDAMPHTKKIVTLNQITPSKNKIKYIYRVGTFGDYTLWLGGWRRSPVQIKTFDPIDRSFLLKNTGGDRYWLDYFTQEATNLGAYVSLVDGVEVYRHVWNQAPDEGYNSGGASLFGYSFAVSKAGGSSGGGTGTFWQRLFQGEMLGGINFGDAVHRYVTPNVVSPETNSSSDPVYLTGAINQTGDRGIGKRVSFSDNTETIAVYSNTDGIVDTRVTYSGDLYLDNGLIDCFDATFSAIDLTNFNTQALNQSQFTVNVAIYNFDAARIKLVASTVYGIPTAHRDTAVIVGTPSYNPL